MSRVGSPVPVQGGYGGCGIVSGCGWKLSVDRMRCGCSLLWVMRDPGNGCKALGVVF